MGFLRSSLLPIACSAALTFIIASCTGRQDIIISAAASPDRLSPSKGESALISYSLSSKSIVSVVILDKNDRVARFILNREIKPSGSYSYTWKGDDDSGAIVDKGIYFYEIIADEDRRRGSLSVY